MGKLGFLLLSLFCAVPALGNVKISDLPLGSAATSGSSDPFPYVELSSSTTKRMRLSDLIHLPAFATFNAATATALQNIPTGCSSGQFAHGIDVQGNLTCSAPAAGTVTSVALSLPGIFSVSGSPVTTSGTLSASLASQSQNLVFASPLSGSGTPAFRALGAADVPTLNQNTTGNAATASALAAVPTGCSAGQVATSIGANGNLTCSASYTSAPTGSTIASRDSSGNSFFNVLGVGESSLNAGATLDVGGTTGGIGFPILTDPQRNAVVPDRSGVVIYNSDNGRFEAFINGFWTALSPPSLPLSIVNGGTGQSSASDGFNALSPMTTLGDTIYGGASGAGTRLAGNTTTTKKFYTQTGDGSNSAAPGWNTIAAADLPAPSVSTISALDIDWSILLKSGGMYKKTLAANSTFTFSNKAVGCIQVWITNTASNYTVTWPTVKWLNDTTPTQTIGAKTDIYGFCYDGTTVAGIQNSNFNF